MRILKPLAMFLLIGGAMYGPATALTKANQELYRIDVKSREAVNRVVESQVRGHKVLADQPKQFGADDLAPSPPEYLAIAYSSCVVSTLRFVAMVEKIDIQNIQVEVEGEIDFSKAMGLSTTNRAGFSNLKVKISFDSTMTQDEKRVFVDNAMARGVVLDNVLNSTPVSFEMVN